MSASPYSIAIVKPITITNGMLAGTDIAEDDYPQWNSGTTYALGDRVILISTHKIYESLQAGNLNKDPVTQPTWWVEVSATNRWKLFDTLTSTQTIQPDSPSNTFFYELQVGEAVNALAAINLTNCNQIHIQMISPSAGSPGIVYDETVDLTAAPLLPDWWSWFFGTKIAPQQYVALDLPTYPDATIYVTFSGGDSLAVGGLLLGQQQRFGLGMRYGARVGIQDYSRKETNEFGDTVLVQRAFAKRANFSIFMEKAETDVLQSYLASVRATPCLWIGSSEYDSTVIYGFYNNFDILITYPEHSECDLEIEGLT